MSELRPSLKLSDSRIVVTGAAGFLGSKLTARLVGLGARVLAIGLAPGRLENFGPHKNYIFKSCDLDRGAGVVEAIGNFAPHYLYHFACHPDGKEQFDQVKQAIQRNISLTVHALEGFKAGGEGELFIFGDSTKVYGDSEVPYRASMPVKPLSSYAIGKVASWEFCRFYRRLHGISSVSVRPTMIYGPEQGWNLFSFVMKSVLEGKTEIRLDGGSQTRDPLFIDDAISAYLAVAEHSSRMDGEVVNIGGGREYSVRELAETTVRLMGSEVPVIGGHVRETEMARSWCDNIEAEQLLGWRPKTDLETGLQQLLISAGITPCVPTCLVEEPKVF